MLGYYLFKFKEDLPQKYIIITAWENKLSIDDVNMYISKGINNKGKTYKELIIGYKTIYINIYNTVV